MCQHIEEAKKSPHKHIVRTAKTVCEECAKIPGATWAHLRQCKTCGAVLCCDSSPNRHMTRHFQASKHPVSQSIERGEAWYWCFVDQIMDGA